MLNGYDKPLHSLPEWKLMRSFGCKFDEIGIDKAIANVLGDPHNKPRKRGRPLWLGEEWRVEE